MAEAADRPVVQQISGRGGRGGGVYTGPGSPTYEAARRALQTENDRRNQAAALAAQKEARAASDAAAARAQAGQKIDVQVAHNAAQEELAAKREALDAAYKHFQTVKEGEELDQKTQILNDAGNYIAGRAKIMSDPDDSQKSRWLRELEAEFKSARLNPEVSKMMEKDDAQFGKALGPPAAQDIQLYKQLQKDYPDGIEQGLNDTIAKGRSGAYPSQLMKEAYFALLKRMGNQPANAGPEDLGAAPTATPTPTPTPASTATPAPTGGFNDLGGAPVPPTGTPKAEQQAAWAETPPPATPTPPPVLPPTPSPTSGQTGGARYLQG